MLYSPFYDHSLIAISGEDARSFLQGIISNDIYKATASTAIYALILTPQGKYLHELFIVEYEGMLLLSCASKRLPELLRKLTLYKLRSKVTISDVSSGYVMIALPDASQEEEGEVKAFLEGISYSDPRSRLMGARAILPREHAITTLENAGFQADECAYEKQRIQHAIAEGEKDLLPEKAFPLEYGMEVLHAIDFKKGCYVGQEVTARTKYRGTLRKHIYRVESKQPLPAYGTEITANNIKIGTLCSSLGTEGLALLRIEEYETAKTQGWKCEAEGEEIRVIS